MQKIELYECEFCGTKYSKESDCLRCESNHISKEDIKMVDFKYRPYDVIHIKWPQFIYVQRKSDVTRFPEQAMYEYHRNLYTHT